MHIKTTQKYFVFIYNMDLEVPGSENQGFQYMDVWKHWKDKQDREQFFFVQDCPVHHRTHSIHGPHQQTEETHNVSEHSSGVELPFQNHWAREPFTFPASRPCILKHLARVYEKQGLGLDHGAAVRLAMGEFREGYACLCPTVE